MLKVGLIGCGFMGSMHAACYKVLSDKVEITAIADVREEKALAQGTNAKIYRDADELIENADVDFIDICLPTYLHTEYAVKAMKKGRDVFVEKPLCRTEEEAEQLLAVQKETGRTVQVGQVVRFNKPYNWLKDAVESKKYGKLLSASFHRLSPYPTWAWDGWLHDFKRSGSMVLDLHIHDLDFVRYMLGEPDTVSAVGSKRPDGQTDYVFTTMNYGDAAVKCEASWSFPESYAFSAGFTALFEKAAATCEGADLTLFPEDGAAQKIVLAEEFAGKLEGQGNISSLGDYFTEIKYFVERMENRAMPEIAPMSEGAASVKLALKAYKCIE